MRIDLRHKVVCITGAAGGIGRAIAEAFAQEGARLALLSPKRPLPSSDTVFLCLRYQNALL